MLYRLTRVTVSFLSLLSFSPSFSPLFLSSLSLLSFSPLFLSLFLPHARTHIHFIFQLILLINAKLLTQLRFEIVFHRFHFGNSMAFSKRPWVQTLVSRDLSRWVSHTRRNDTISKPPYSPLPIKWLLFIDISSRLNAGHIWGSHTKSISFASCEYDVIKSAHNRPQHKACKWQSEFRRVDDNLFEKPDRWHSLLLVY